MLAVLALAMLQEPPADPCDLDRRIDLEITRLAAPLPGRGGSLRLEHEAAFAGTLHVWTESEAELDLFLRAEDLGGAVLAQDDDSGGGGTPWLHLAVQEGTRLAIVVAASRPGTAGRFALRLVAAPETDRTRAAVERADLELAEVGALRASGDLVAARGRLDSSIAELLSVPGALRSERVEQCLLDAADREARELGLLELQARIRRSVLAHRLDTLPPDHPDLQRMRGNLAVVLYELGDLEPARELAETVHAVFSRTLPGDSPDLQRARLHLAAMRRSRGDLAGARILEEGALEVLGRTLAPDDPLVRNVRHNLATTLSALGDLEGARDLLAELVETESLLLPSDDPSLLLSRQNLAAVLGQLGDVESARRVLAEILEIQSAKLPEEHPSLQSLRRNLAAALYELRELAGARALQESILAVDARTLPEDNPDLAHDRHNLASTLRDMGELDAFTRLAAEFIDGLREVVARVALRTAPRETEERAANEAKHAAVALLYAAGEPARGNDPVLSPRAFALVESLRSAGLVSARLLNATAVEPALARLLHEVRSASNEIARIAQTGGEGDSLARALERRDRIQRELLDALEGSEAASGLLVEPTAAALASVAGHGAALVGYWSYEPSPPIASQPLDSAQPAKRLLAHVIVPDGTLARIDLGPIEAVEDAVQAWRDALTTSPERGVAAAGTDDVGAIQRERGAALRRLVVDPLKPALGDARSVIVALDDVLHTVPLDALPDGDQPLGERLRIVLRLSLRELLWTSRAPAGTALLAIGGAAFNSDPLAASEQDAADLEERSERAPEVAAILRGGAWERGFARLTYSSIEARGVAALYSEVFAGGRSALVLEERKASRAAVEELAPRARFLHIATHGWFAPESVRSRFDPDPATGPAGAARSLRHEEMVSGSSPMVLCGLALAGANLPPDEVGRYPGLVTAEEIASWDLSSCELAVLSACDTNVGVRRAGQGVASLQKALQMAGARSVITSLWKVPDEATKELMLDFYRRLWVQKKPKHQALWEAKMKLRSAKDEQGRPIYTTRDWAAWVLTGDSD